MVMFIHKHSVGQTGPERLVGSASQEAEGPHRGPVPERYPPRLNQVPL